MKYDDIKFFVEQVSIILEIAGVIATVIGGAVATYEFTRAPRRACAYSDYRRGLGQAILLGLEFLVAADIIRTVAVTPTFESVGVLAGIVLIRTFLSISLEVEINGRFPWQDPKPKT